MSENEIEWVIRVLAPMYLARKPGACRSRVAAPMISFSSDWEIDTGKFVGSRGLLTYEPRLTLVAERVINAWRLLDGKVLDDAIVLDVRQACAGSNGVGPIYKWAGVTLRLSQLTVVDGFFVKCGRTKLTGRSRAGLARSAALYNAYVGDMDWNRTSFRMQSKRFPVGLISNARLRRQSEGHAVELCGVREAKANWAEGPFKVLRPDSMRVDRASDGAWVEVSAPYDLERYERRLAERLNPDRSRRRQPRVLKKDLDALLSVRW